MAGVSGASARDQLARDRREGGESHEDHEGFGHADPAPIDGVDAVAGDEGHGGSVLAVRQRHAGVGRDAERRGDAGNDLEGDAGIGQRFGFFAAAAEDERIAALEAHHVPAAARALDEHGADFFLGEGVGGFLLADVDALGGGGGEIEQASFARWS